jgi:hypothetical protein
VRVRHVRSSLKIADLHGFRESGRKSFTLDYKFDGPKKRLFIGDFPDWSTTAAREY